MLSPVATQPSEVRLIRCHAGGESFCLPMAGVRSIQRRELLGDEPRPEGALVGWLSAFGKRLPVLGLARRLGLPEPAAGGSGAVVVFDDPAEPWGLAVDRLSRAPAVAARDVLALPALVDPGARGPFHGVVRLGEELSLYLAPERLHPRAPAAPPAPAAPAPHRAPAGASRRPAAPGRIVVFSTSTSGPLRFALSLGQVEEIARPRPLVRVPGAPALVLGLAAWRRRALPVIDLAARLGAGASDPGAGSRLLVARAAGSGERLAFPVRPDVRVVALPLACQPVAPRSPLDPRSGAWLRGLFELDGGLLAVPDVDALVGTPANR